MKHEHATTGSVTGVVYERRDTTLGPIVQSGIVLLGISALTMVLMYYLHKLIVEHTHSDQPAPHPMLQANEPVPGPRLQGNSYSDLRAYKADQALLTGQYGWIDAESKQVRLPVDRGIELLLQEGLPALPAKEVGK